MTRAEWLVLVGHITTLWPQAARWSEQTIDAWYGKLSKLPTIAIAASIDDCFNDGRDYPPHGPELYRRAIDIVHRLPKPEPVGVLAEPELSEAEELSVTKAREAIQAGKWLEYMASIQPVEPER